uniref:Uncharacterized protein n=1 Tax=Physcomitrium patens TaxID=3218 RepID=A0A2K1L963_PHYPA|nr:hypothetical protein PHYPA_000965 [Physcomitrium patens]
MPKPVQTCGSVCPSVCIETWIIPAPRENDLVSASCLLFVVIAPNSSPSKPFDFPMDLLLLHPRHQWRWN